jgi:RHS repeat-associated protein
MLRRANTWLTLAWDESTDNARVSWYELFQDGQSLGLVPPSSAAFYDITGFQPGQTVTYSVRARDISGNYSGNSTPLVLTTTDYDDTEAPYLDWNFWVTNTGVNGFTINWDAGTDNVGVVAYEISGIGDVPVETTSTSYTFAGLYPDAWYWFNIRARDAAGNWSDMINCEACTDYEDYYDYNWDILPTTPQSLHVTSSSESYIALAWEPSQHPAGVVAYDIYRDGDYLDLTWDPYLSYVDVNVEAGQSYTYTVVAWTYDNQSNPSDAVTAIATGSSIYTLSPPSELAVYDVGPSSFAISWTPATAPVGYPWFRLFVNGQLKGSVPPYSKPFCLITGLTAGTDYTVTICMLDVLGNVSAESTPVSVTTLLMPPAGLHLENKTHGTITLAWSAPADATGITGYEIMRNNATIATVGPGTFLYTDQNLAVATYLYHVVAVNNAGGRSVPSGSLSVVMEENSLPAWAEANGLNPNDAQDMLDDPDGDGLTNIAEFNLGKTPHSYDQGSSTLGTAVPAGWPAPNPADTHAVGATAGEFSVDKNGAATYTVPIAVTPGTAGVEPKITLNYSSQAGPGIAGFGWSIGGLSAISRGPQTKLVDGQNRAMDFTRNDRFYLDGQRLVVINGTYSYDGAEYRTEMESFTRVVSYGSTGNSPAWFKAWTKGGLVIEFGHTADSAFRPQNQTDPLSWAVSKISDTVGNYMTFHYEVEITSGQQVLKSINYTGHDGTPSVQPYASLEFEYEPRPDTSFGYVVGAKISSLQRLKAVKSRHGSAVVRTYALNYSQRDYNKRSILDSITEAGADGVAYHPLTFAYSNPPGGMQAVPDFFHLPTFIARADANGRMADQGVVFIDLNGDGRTDCVQKLGANGSVVNRAWLNTPDGWVAAIGTNGQPDYRLPNPLTLSANNRNATNPDTGVRFADFNNDGLVDIIAPTGNVYLNTGAGFFLNQRFSLPDEPPPDDNNYYYDWFSRGWPETLDLDGDGRADVSARSSFEYTEYDSYYDEYIYHSYEAHDTWINTGGGTEGVRGSAWEHAPEHTVPLVRGDTGVRYMDINGDGLTDILQSYGTIRRAYLKTPSGWSNTTAYHLPLPLFSGYSTTTGLGGELVDLNGDGLPDFIAYNNGSSNYQNAAYINTGKGWIPAPPAMLPPTALYYNNTPNGAAFIDFDNDGLPDLLAGNSATHLNTGSGWMTATPDYRLPRALYQYNRGNPGNEFIDLNADGAADLIWSWQDGSTSTKGAYVNSRVNPDRLASVTNGLGVTVFVTYAPLTETVTAGGGDPVYEKDTGASFPVTDAIGPMYVVKTVSHEDGAGGWYDIGYRYGGLRFHADRGSLGFAWMQVTDSRTQIRTKTLFRQTHPFIGLPDGAITTQENGNSLSETATTYEYLSLNNGKTIFPYAAETIQKTYELNGDLTSETVTTYAYDTFGNATVIEIDTSGGDAVFTKTVTSTYENWVSAPSSTGLGGWMPGRLLSSTVTTTAPNPDGGAPFTQTRTSDFEYSTTTGLLTTEIIEPDAPDDPVTQAPSPLKLTTTYAYDSFGNKTTVTTTGAGLGAGRTATTTHTANGRFPLKTANALGHEETYAYDPALGVLLSTTGPNGLTTRWEYDALARPSREIRADGAVSITRQCWAAPDAPEGALYYIETESTASAPAVVFYDKMGRAISSWSVNPGGHDGLARIVTTETLYDSMGRARATSLPHYLGEDAPGWSEILSYDILNRPLQVSTPDDEADGGAVVSSIEYAGLVTRTTNPLGQVEEATKDTQGRIIKRVNNATETTDLSQRGEIHYTYDAYGNLLKTAVHNEDGTAVETTFEYDNRGRKTGMTSPDMGTWTYHYNALAELVSQTDAKGQTTTMTYDALGRLATRTDRDASDAVACTTTWTYDDITTSGPKSKGKLSAVLVETAGKPDYKETYLYDDLGRQIRLTRRIDGADYSVGQEYDSFGRPAVTIYPGGFRVRNIYSTLGFLKEVRADGGLAPSGWLGDVRLNHLFWQADAYTVTGAISGGAIGNGLTYDRDVSPVTGRVRAVVSGIGLGTHAQYHVYNYDKLGQVVQREDLVLGRKETFAYDGLNRLTQYNVEAASLPLGSTGATGIPPVIPKTVTQTYNALGNITQKSDYGIYSYSGVNAGPHAVTSVYDAASDTTRTYTYDANGNQTSGAGRTLDWTVFNQVETITQGAISTQFRFGAGRERVVQEHSDGTKTIYIGDLYEKVINTATGLTEEKYHVYSPFGKVATRTVRSDASIETRYCHLDGLGSIVAVSDEWGRIEKRFTFDPWGKREMPLDTHAGQGGEVTRGFTGHEHLDDFGLIHMNGRIFDPSLGRFLSPDPIVGDAEWSQSYNRYSYVDNNPLNATDPSGYFSLKQLIPIIIAIVVTLVVTYCTAGTGTPAAAGFFSVIANAGTGAVVAGAAAGGFAGSFAGALMNGASFGAAFKAGLKSAAISAATAYAAQGIGGYFNGAKDAKGIWANDYANWGGRTLAHATVGGVTSELEGGEFRHGFLSSAASNGIMHIGGVQSFMGGDAGGWYIAGRTAVAALIGGTAAELSGGKFSNGAWTSALQHLFNQEAAKAITRKHLVTLFIDAKMVKDNDAVAIEAQNMVNSLNTKLEQAGVAERVELISYDSLDDLENKVKLFVNGDTKLAAIIAHGLFKDVNDPLTYTKKVSINGLPFSEVAWKNRFDAAVGSINKTILNLHISCNILGGQYNSKWYNISLNYINPVFARANYERALKRLEALERKK